MEVTCPSCSSSFNVPTDLLGDSGRDVRCGKCGHIWHVDPPAVDWQSVLGGQEKPGNHGASSDASVATKPQDAFSHNSDEDDIAAAVDADLGSFFDDDDDDPSDALAELMRELESLDIDSFDESSSAPTPAVSTATSSTPSPMTTEKSSGGAMKPAVPPRPAPPTPPAFSKPATTPPGPSQGTTSALSTPQNSNTTTSPKPSTTPTQPPPTPQKPGTQAETSKASPSAFTPASPSSQKPPQSSHQPESLASSSVKANEKSKSALSDNQSDDQKAAIESPKINPARPLAGPEDALQEKSGKEKSGEKAFEEEANKAGASPDAAKNADKNLTAQKPAAFPQSSKPPETLESNTLASTRKSPPDESSTKLSTQDNSDTKDSASSKQDTKTEDAKSLTSQSAAFISPSNSLSDKSSQTEKRDGDQAVGPLKPSRDQGETSQAAQNSQPSAFGEKGDTQDKLRETSENKAAENKALEVKESDKKDLPETPKNDSQTLPPAMTQTPHDKDQGTASYNGTPADSISRSDPSSEKAVLGANTPAIVPSSPTSSPTLSTAPNVTAPNVTAPDPSLEAQKEDLPPFLSHPASNRDAYASKDGSSPVDSQKKEKDNALDDKKIVREQEAEKKRQQKALADEEKQKQKALADEEKQAKKAAARKEKEHRKEEKQAAKAARAEEKAQLKASKLEAKQASAQQASAQQASTHEEKKSRPLPKKAIAANIAAVLGTFVVILKSLAFFALVVAAIGIVIGGGAYIFKDPIADTFPVTKSYYKEFDIVAGTPGHGLEIPKSDVQVVLRAIEGKRMIFVTGVIRNTVDNSVEVPDIQVNVVNERDDVLKSWVAEPQSRLLESRRVLEFETSSESVAGAKSVKVVFVHPKVKDTPSP